MGVSRHFISGDRRAGTFWIRADVTSSAVPKHFGEELKVKVKFTLEQATKAQTGSRGIAVNFNLGTRWGGWLVPRPGRFNPGNDPVPFV